MRETGVVTEIKGKFAVVSVDKKEECAGCGLCLFKDNATKTEFYALNVRNARKGDAVVVENSERGKLWGALLVFFAPLLLIGLAVAINYLFIKNEIWILALAAAFIAAWYAILSLLDGKFRKSGAFNSEIVEILSPETDGDSARITENAEEGNNTNENNTKE